MALQCLRIERATYERKTAVIRILEAQPCYTCRIVMQGICNLVIPREAKGYSFGLVGLSVCPSVRPSVTLFF